MERTLVDLFRQSVHRYADNPMIWEKSEGEYQSISYRASFEMVAEVAAGLIKLGLGQGDRVVLLSEGRNDWILAELGILFAGGVCVPLSIKIQEPAKLRFRISHSNARFAIASGNQLDKILEIKNDLARLEKIIVLDPYEKDNPDFIRMIDIKSEGKAFQKKYPDRFEKRWQAVKENDAAHICYTPGTAGDSKGVILTHRNYTANIEQITSLYDFAEHYISLVILPWDHPFVHSCGIFGPISCGASVASIELGSTPIESSKNIGKNIKEIRPHVILSTPAFSARFKRSIERGISSLGSRVERLFGWGLKVAHAYQRDGFRKGRRWGNIFFKPLYSFFDGFIFSKIRAQFGERLKYFIGGGDLLDIEYLRFFSAVGMPIYPCYGLSEAVSVVSANHPGNLKMGTSGSIVSDLSVKICDDDGVPLTDGETGEIVVQGGNVMKSYWGIPKATKEVLNDGWLHTGDVGYIDDEGFLVVLGRKDYRIISPEGETFSPEGIEESLAAGYPAIQHALLFNDQKPYTVALIVPDKQTVRTELEAKGLTLASADGQRMVIDLFMNIFQMYRTNSKLKKRFPEKWIPATFAILGESFTVANGFLNSSLKLVRRRIMQHYQDRIDFMYTAEGRDAMNAQNMTIVGRMADQF